MPSKLLFLPRLLQIENIRHRWGAVAPLRWFHGESFVKFATETEFEG